MAEVFRCRFDSLPCDRFSYDLGFGVCKAVFIGGLKAKRFDICSRSVSKTGDSLEVLISV